MELQLSIYTEENKDKGDREVSGGEQRISVRSYNPGRSQPCARSNNNSNAERRRGASGCVE
jgi:hypothetical protein